MMSVTNNMDQDIRASRGELQVRIALLEDDVELATMLRDFLGQGGFSVDVFHDGRRAWDALQMNHYDLALLDVMVPHLDGMTVLRKLRRISALPVIMLTAKSDLPDRIAGLSSGADDYLGKPFDPLELLARIRSVLRRAQGTALTEQPVELQRSGVTLNRAERSVAIAGMPVALTTLEFDILETLMEAAGRIVSRDELAREIYQRPLNIGDRAIDVHVGHLRKKLAPGGDLIRTVRSIGYQFVDRGEEAM